MLNSADKKIIKVTCAIIEDDGKIMAAQRSEAMGMGLKWEFPGGKVETGEKYEDSIIRELMEEMDIEVSIISSLPSHIHNYETRTIELIPFICKIIGGKVKCKEHKAVIWDTPEKLAGLDWAEADVPIYNEYIRHYKSC